MAHHLALLLQLAVAVIDLHLQRVLLLLRRQLERSQITLEPRDLCTVVE